MKNQASRQMEFQNMKSVIEKEKIEPHYKLRVSGGKEIHAYQEPVRARFYKFTIESNSKVKEKS